MILRRVLCARIAVNVLCDVYALYVSMYNVNVYAVRRERALANKQFAAGKWATIIMTTHVFELYTRHPTTPTCSDISAHGKHGCHCAGVLSVWLVPRQPQATRCWSRGAHSIWFCVSIKIPIFIVFRTL